MKFRLQTVRAALIIGLGIIVILTLVVSVYFVKKRQDARAHNGPYSASTPTPGEVLIRVPILEQPEQYACNVTAAAIVLQHHGIQIDPMVIYDALPKQSIPKANGFWGNPNLGYVGNIYGEFGGDKSEGYGVHWDPIQKFISQYRPAEVKRNWNVKELLEEVKNGNLSILWWQNGAVEPVPLQWQSYDEQGNQVTIYGVEAMHSAVVIGYIGTPENPSKIIVSDPWSSRWNGQYAYYDLTEFTRLWSYFQNTAILVK